MWYQNICSASFRFVTIYAYDRQTDGQNYESQDQDWKQKCPVQQPATHVYAVIQRASVCSIQQTDSSAYQADGHIYAPRQKKLIQFAQTTSGP